MEQEQNTIIMSNNKPPRFKDDDGEWVYAGDTITFSYGIPPINVRAKIINRSGTLWVLPKNQRCAECCLRSLRLYVGSWWKVKA